MVIVFNLAELKFFFPKFCSLYGGRLAGLRKCVILEW